MQNKDSLVALEVEQTFNSEKVDLLERFLPLKTVLLITSKDALIKVSVSDKFFVLLFIQNIFHIWLAEIPQLILFFI